MQKGWITGTGRDTTKLAIRHMLVAVGEDPDRSGLEETPDRVINSWKELFAGYDTDVKELFKVFDVSHDQMVVVTNIDFVSFCEHHMLPFQGVAHVGYVPNGKVIGLSKIGRVVDVFAKRFQVQERMTDQISDAIQTGLAPKGVACQVTARHMCMACRGVKKENAEMTTSSLTGCFRDEADCRSEFYSIVAQRSR